MKKFSLLLFTFYALVGCEPKSNQNTATEKTIEGTENTTEQQDYSTEFYNHFKSSKTILSGDSLIFSDTGWTEIVRIPQYIPRNSEISFFSKNGHSITIKQINYTDIEFIISEGEQTAKGQATLLPTFYLGAETIDFAENEYVLSHYYVSSSTNSCIDFIGLGNQCLSSEALEATFAVVSMAGGGCETLLTEIANRKLKQKR